MNDKARPADWKLQFFSSRDEACPVSACAVPEDAGDAASCVSTGIHQFDHSFWHSTQTSRDSQAILKAHAQMLF